MGGTARPLATHGVLPTYGPEPPVPFPGRDASPLAGSRFPPGDPAAYCHSHEALAETREPLVIGDAHCKEPSPYLPRNSWVRPTRYPDDSARPALLPQHSGEGSLRDSLHRLSPASQAEIRIQTRRRKQPGRIRHHSPTQSGMHPTRHVFVEP